MLFLLSISTLVLSSTTTSMSILSCCSRCPCCSCCSRGSLCPCGPQCSSLPSLSSSCCPCCPRVPWRWASVPPVSIQALPGRAQGHHPVQGLRSHCCCCPRLPQSPQRSPQWASCCCPRWPCWSCGPCSSSPRCSPSFCRVVFFVEQSSEENERNRSQTMKT